MAVKILVVGDAMADCYWHGDISRISPEAPVPVVSIKRVEKREGAAANVANNIEAMGVPCERIFGGGERIQKIRVLVRQQHFARMDYDYPQAPIEADATFEEACARCAIVVMADYGKGSLENVQALIQAALKHRCEIFIDPKGHDYAKYRGAALIKPNKDEMRELVGGWHTQEELDFKARQFLVASGIESILLTQAGDGMTLYTAKETRHFPSVAQDVVDVSGAGETALSAFASARALGHDAAEAAEVANRAAGLSVGRQGTAVIRGEEIFGTH